MVEGGEQHGACATDNKTVDSYLVFPYVMTEAANEIVLEVKNTLRTCLFLNRNCKYSIDFYAMKIDSGKDILPSPMENKYLFAGRLQNQSALSSQFKDFVSSISTGMDGRKEFTLPSEILAYVALSCILNVSKCLVFWDALLRQDSF